MKTMWIFPFIYSRLIRYKQQRVVWLLINNYFHFSIYRCLTSGKIFSVHYSSSILMDQKSWCHFISLLLKIDKQTDQILSHETRYSIINTNWPFWHLFFSIFILSNTTIIRLEIDWKKSIFQAHSYASEMLRFVRIHRLITNYNDHQEGKEVK